MAHSTPLEREQPVIERNQGVLRDVIILKAHGHEVEFGRRHYELVRVNAPSFFRDEGFIRWLNSDVSGPATWHARGDKPGEYSDVFINFGGAIWGERYGFSADGSDYPNLKEHPGIPDPIYALIAEAVVEDTGSMANECLVWIINL